MSRTVKNASRSRRVVVAGGGYVGWEIARDLDVCADVTLIEQREAFVHAPAMIRALLQPQLLERAIIPYNTLLQRGRVLRARVRSVEADGVTLDSGERVPADYIVIATGSRYAAPFKPQDGSVESLRAASRETRARLLDAGRIAIVGAGAVGTELAGEIAHALPDKHISLISSETRLFPMYPPKLGAQLQRKLETKGVTACRRPPSACSSVEAQLEVGRCRRGPRRRGTHADRFGAGAPSPSRPWARRRTGDLGHGLRQPGAGGEGDRIGGE
jgi:NADH dehydrogenase FAD-containing subunit